MSYFKWFKKKWTSKFFILIEIYKEFKYVRLLSRLFIILFNFLLYLDLVIDIKIDSIFYLNNIIGRYINIYFSYKVNSILFWTWQFIFFFGNIWFFIIIYYSKIENNQYFKSYINIFINISPIWLFYFLINFPSYFLFDKNSNNYLFYNINNYSFYLLMSLVIHIFNIFLLVLISLINLFMNKYFLVLNINRFFIKSYTVLNRYIIIIIFLILKIIKIQLNLKFSKISNIIFLVTILFLESTNFFINYFKSPYFNLFLNNIENNLNLLIINFIIIIFKNYLTYSKIYLGINNILWVIIIFSFEVKLWSNINEYYKIKTLNFIYNYKINLNQFKQIFSIIFNNNFNECQNKNIISLSKIINSHEFSCNNILCCCNIGYNKKIELSENEYVNMYILLLIQNINKNFEKIKSHEFLFFYVNLIYIKLKNFRWTIKIIKILNKKIKNKFKFFIYKKYVIKKIENNIFENNIEKKNKFYNYHNLYWKMLNCQKLYMKQIIIKNDIFLFFEDINISILKILKKIEEFEINDIKISKYYDFINKNSDFQLYFLNKIYYYIYMQYWRFFDYKSNELLLEIINNDKFKRDNVNLNENFDKIAVINISKNNKIRDTYIINSSTKNIDNILLLNKDEVINSVFEKFLPEKIKDIHHIYMNDFYLLKKFKINNKEFNTFFMLDNDKKLIQINLFVKYKICKENNNIEFVCFIKKIEDKESIYLQLDNTNKIINFSWSKYNENFKINNLFSNYNNDINDYLNSVNKIKEEYFKRNMNLKNYNYNWIIDDLIKFYEFSKGVALPLKVENNKIIQYNIKILEYFLINHKDSVRFIEISSFKLDKIFGTDYNSFFEVIFNQNIINNVLNIIKKNENENFDRFKFFQTIDDESNLNNVDTILIKTSMVGSKELLKSKQKIKKKIKLKEENIKIEVGDNKDNFLQHINKNEVIDSIDSGYSSSYQVEFEKVLYVNIFLYNKFKILKLVKIILLLYIFLNILIVILNKFSKILIIKDINNTNLIYKVYSLNNLEYSKISYHMNIYNLIENGYINKSIYDTNLKINIERKNLENIMNFKFTTYNSEKNLPNLLFINYYPELGIRNKILEYEFFSNDKKIIIKKDNKNTVLDEIKFQFYNLESQISKNINIINIPKNEWIKVLLDNLNSSIYSNNISILNIVKNYVVNLNNVEFYWNWIYYFLRILLLVFILVIILYYWNKSYTKKINFLIEIFKFKKNYEINDFVNYFKKIKSLLIDLVEKEDNIFDKLNKFKNNYKFKEIINQKFNALNFIDNNTHLKNYLYKFLKIFSILFFFVILFIIINLSEYLKYINSIYNLNYLHKFNYDWENQMFRSINGIFLYINYGETFTWNNVKILDFIDQNTINLNNIISEFEVIRNRDYGEINSIVKQYFETNKLCNLLWSNNSNICKNSSFTLLSKDFSLLLLEYYSFLNNFLINVRNWNREQVINYLNRGDTILNIYYINIILENFIKKFIDNVDKKEANIISENLRWIYLVSVLDLLWFCIIMVYLYNKKIEIMKQFFVIINKTITFLPLKILKKNHIYNYYISKIIKKFRN